MKALYVSLVAVVGILSAGVAQAAGEEELAKKEGCLTCHAVDKKVIGPSYKDIAKRYAGQKGIEPTLIEKVTKGGKGNWKKELGAEIPMTPNPKLKPENADKLIKWILSLK